MKYDIINAQVYVGTYAKYSRGSLRGEWMSLKDFKTKSDFEAACCKLHSDERQPEFMFQDMTGLPEKWCNESYVSPELFVLIQMILEEQKSLDADALSAFLEVTDYEFEDLVAEYILEQFVNLYVGQHGSIAEYYQQLGSDMFCFYELKEKGVSEKRIDFFESYFDYESYARDQEINRKAYSKRCHVFAR